MFGLFLFFIHVRFHCKMLFCKIVQDGIDESINNVNCNKCQENEMLNFFFFNYLCKHKKL